MRLERAVMHAPTHDDYVGVGYPRMRFDDASVLVEVQLRCSPAEAMRIMGIARGEAFDVDDRPPPPPMLTDGTKALPAGPIEAEFIDD